MKLKAPEGCGGVSFEGKICPAKKGVIEVPDHAPFLEWGFSRADGAPEPAPAEAAPEPETEAKK